MTKDDIDNYIYVLVDYCFPTVSWDCLVYYLIFQLWLRPSAFFDRTNINIIMTTIKYTMYNVQDYNGLYNKAFLPVI